MARLKGNIWFLRWPDFGQDREAEMSALLLKCSSQQCISAHDFDDPFQQMLRESGPQFFDVLFAHRELFTVKYHKMIIAEYNRREHGTSDKTNVGC